jgi:hypothetical protein
VAGIQNLCDEYSGDIVEWILPNVRLISVTFLEPILEGVSGGIANILGGGSMDYSE